MLLAPAPSHTRAPRDANDVRAPWQPAQRPTTARALYFALLGERGADVGCIDELARSASRSFLADRLADAAAADCAFAPNVRALADWLHAEHAQTASAYRAYVDERHAGAPRRYFSSKSHALHFLRAVAPTKLVDGAWLYGLLAAWQDARLAPLIRIYLEELGDGRAEQHHVLLYRKLLATHGCEQWQQLSDDHFTQGAIQLSLAHHAAEFLPEVIGFNLGYEQLPLHLPITAYELNELDIDPYYFTLHVTVDNASTGHARKSLDCLQGAMPRFGDARRFYERVANGYKLNTLGVGTAQAIESFDLQRELLNVMGAKAAVGAALHSDYCRIGGRTVGDWLSTPGEMPKFLQALQAHGWIRRGHDPRESRFWRLLQDERAPMFGVFNAREQQLIHDWIADADADVDADVDAATPVAAVASPRRDAAAAAAITVNRFRQRPPAPAATLRTAAAAAAAAVPRGAAPPTLAELVQRHAGATEGPHGNAFDAELQLLRERLSTAADKAQAMALLAGFLSPANHQTPAGTAATRIFSDLFGGHG